MGPAWDPRGTVGPAGPAQDPRGPATKNFPLESRPSLSLLLGRTWTRVDPRQIIGPSLPDERCLGPAQIRRDRGWHGTRVRPAEPAQSASDGLAATQTIYIALEPAKDLRRTPVDPRVTSHPRHKLPRTPTTLDSRLSLSRVDPRHTIGPHGFLMEWTRKAARAA